MPPMPLTDVFAGLPDPRRETANKLHRLTDILAIATCAVIGGAGFFAADGACGLLLDAGRPLPDGPT